MNWILRPRHDDTLDGTIAERGADVSLVGSNTGSAEKLADAMAAVRSCRVESVVDRVFDLTGIEDAYDLANALPVAAEVLADSR